MKRVQSPFGYPSIQLGEYTTSKYEIIDLIKSWVALSIAFSILYNRGFSIEQVFFVTMGFSAVTVGIAFILHELAHKIAAQRYGCSAEFKSADSMLLLAIAMSFFGFIFFAPGAVMISGPVGVKRSGIIAAAGPATNFGLAIIFLMLMMYTEGISSGLTLFFSFGAMINTWIGLFNMIPFWVFDGKKIITWSKPVYFSMVGIGVLLFFARGLL
ncbi:MAG: site-2 protease family protein [Candidatus Woesearchaeota archaeon]